VVDSADSGPWGERSGSEPDDVRETPGLGQAADRAGTPESSQPSVEATADVLGDSPASIEEPLVTETPEAHFADFDGDRSPALEVEDAEAGLLSAAGFEGGDSEDAGSQLQGMEAVSAGLAGAAVTARTGITVDAEPASKLDAAGTVTSEAARHTRQAKPGGRSWLHDFALVAVGGLLGVLATLVILGVLGGTLSYAPRALVNALSDNMSTMQQNQETTWSRTQSLASQVAALEARLDAVEALDSRVAELERGSADTEARLSELRTGLQKLDAGLAEVAERHATLIDDLSGRVAAEEEGLTSIGETVSELRGTVAAIQDQVTRYEAFFDALRGLLLEMQGEGAAADTGM
jgi:uncharacterized coiled-coil protein SlyX